MTNSQASPRFFVKSFFAKSIQDAMAQARVELGPEALLLDSKETAPEARHLGEYEVVFGEYADEAPSQKAAPGPVPVAEIAPAAAPIKRTPNNFAEIVPAAAPTKRTPNNFAGILRSVEEIRSLLADAGDAADDSEDDAAADAPPDPASQKYAQRVADVLMKADVERELALEIGEAVKTRIHRRMVLDISRPRVVAEWDDASLALEAAAEIAARCPVQPEIGPVTALVGPPGAGKTTTLVKLAVSQGLAAGKAVRLVSVDTHRIGAAAQLEIYASILGVPFQVVDTPAALAQVIDYAPANSLLLIDTPGYSASLFDELGGDLANLLARRQEVDTHLVLTASMRPEALRRAADLYGAFRPSKLLFTHLDEATSYAAMFCEAARRELPLSFFATGQSIPEDLEPAAVRRLSDSLVWQLPKAMQATA